MNLLKITIWEKNVIFEGYVSGAREAINNGNSGYVVNIYDTTDIIKKIKMILYDDAISSEKCIKWARKNDIEDQVDELLRLYARNSISSG